MVDSEGQRERVRGAAGGLGGQRLGGGEAPPAPQGPAPAPGDSPSRALPAGPGLPFLASFFFKFQGGYNKVGTTIPTKLEQKTKPGEAMIFQGPKGIR